MKYQTPNAIYLKYPPSASCSCETCRNYCIRPGWWTVEEAARALRAGLGSRMMLELAPDLSYGVLSPAFIGCEGGIASKEYAYSGCNFLKEGLCELHSTVYLPLECRFCHHDRKGMGEQCHTDIGREWNCDRAKILINRWVNSILKEVQNREG